MSLITLAPAETSIAKIVSCVRQLIQYIQGLGLDAAIPQIATNTANISTNTANIATDTAAISAMSAAWSNYTPVVSSVVGTITSYTAAGRYQQIGKIVFVAIDLTITNNGTGSNGINITLPVNAKTTVAQSITGLENNASGKANHGTITAGGGAGILFVRQYDNAYPANTGSELIISGTYEGA